MKKKYIPCIYFIYAYFTILYILSSYYFSAPLFKGALPIDLETHTHKTPQETPQEASQETNKYDINKIRSLSYRRVGSRRCVKRPPLSYSWLTIVYLELMIFPFKRVYRLVLGQHYTSAAIIGIN